MDLWIQEGWRSLQMQKELQAAAWSAVIMEGNSKWSTLWPTITRRSVMSLKCHVVSECNSIYTLKKSVALTVDILKKLTNSQRTFFDISCTEFFSNLNGQKFHWRFSVKCAVSCGDFYETHSCLHRLYTNRSGNLERTVSRLFTANSVTQECYCVSCHDH